MIIITGGAGFIGSNIVKKLNLIGRKDIIIVDDLKNGRKVFNLNDLDIYDYIDKENFISKIDNKHNFPKIEAIFHQGACSKTTEWDGKYVMFNNYDYSKKLLNFALDLKISFIYASSASVYGLGDNGFEEKLTCENPMNIYAYSKFQFDQYIRNILDKAESQIVGLRYFNVYGQRESHKKSMASTAFHFNNQIIAKKECELFKGINGYNDGEQLRDFVYVDDCVDVNLWFFNNKQKSGIFNVGSGRAESFNEMANSVIAWHREKLNVKSKIKYIPFPQPLIGSYQNFTKANLNSLRKVGYKKNFHSVREGVSKYLDIINCDLIK